MNILYVGTPEFSIPILEKLINSEHKIVSILTMPDALLGRKKLLAPSPVANYAAKYNIPIIKSNKITQKISSELASMNIDIAIVFAYGVLIPKYALNIFKYGWINIHLSLLPKYRGAAPIQHAIIAGETITGASIFQIDSGMDSGPIFHQWKTLIDDFTSAGTLLNKLTNESGEHVINTLKKISRGEKPKSQIGDISLAPKLQISNAHIDFNKDSKAVIRHINGVNPEPGAWVFVGKKRLKIHNAIIADQILKLEPGKLFFKKAKPMKLFVSTRNGSIELITVQPFGKKIINAIDYANGMHSKLNSVIFK